MESKKNPSARKTDIVVQELKGEALIYDLQINKAFCLNETSALVYVLCDGNNSISEISNQLSKKLKQPFTEDLVWLAINQLKQENLLEQSDEIETKFDGLSRREVIRKVSFASVIALPVIATLIAPTAAMAQSPGTSTCPTAGNTFCAGSASDCATNAPGNCGNANCTATATGTNAICTALGNVTCTCA